jgi:hypothetical protein
MKSNKRQDDDATIRGSMEMAGASDQSGAYRAQAELVETLARLVLDSVAKANDDERHGEPQAATPTARMGTQ